MFIYQSLDAIDGKQARRTNSQSPLGELFDHGCDSVSAGKLKSNEINNDNFELGFSICYNCLLLCCTIGRLSLVNVLVMYAVFLCILLCTLANIRVGKIEIWKVENLLNQRKIYSICLLFKDSIVLKLNFHS